MRGNDTNKVLCVQRTGLEHMHMQICSMENKVEALGRPHLILYTANLHIGFGPLPCALYTAQNCTRYAQTPALAHSPDRGS